MKKRDPAQLIANSIDVRDLDKTAKEVEKAGGQIVVLKMSIPGVGYLTYFKDPDGNIHGLYQKDPTAVWKPLRLIRDIDLIADQSRL